jgi:hypothetical protein
MHPAHSTTPLPRFSTSLAYKSELEVDVLMPFACSPPLRLQKRAGGVDLWNFNAVALPPPPSHARQCVGFYRILTVFAPPPPSSCLPRMQQRAEGGFYGFDGICASSTSLACKSQLEVDRYSVSTSFAPPSPTFHAG